MEHDLTTPIALRPRHAALSTHVLVKCGDPTLIARRCKESRTGIRGVSPFCSFDSQEDAKLSRASRVQTAEREGNKMNERAINAYAGNASARNAMGRPVTPARTMTE
jgi:hypothetical protein